MAHGSFLKWEKQVMKLGEASYEISSETMGIS